MHLVRKIQRYVSQNFCGSVHESPKVMKGDVALLALPQLPISDTAAVASDYDTVLKT